jgi:hypothetical protein
MLPTAACEEIMLPSEFRVEQSSRGYRVALYRSGEYYVTFMDGLTQDAAEREARSLTEFWNRIRRRAACPDVAAFKSAS